MDDLDWFVLESLENQRFQTACFLIGFARDSESERSSCLNRVWRGAARNATNDSPTSDYATSIPNQTESATFKSSAAQYASSPQNKFKNIRLEKNSKSPLVVSLSHSAWIDAFQQSGFRVIRLVELTANEKDQEFFHESPDIDWASQWPAEDIWKVEKINEL